LAWIRSVAAPACAVAAAFILLGWAAGAAVLCLLALTIHPSK